MSPLHAISLAGLLLVVATVTIVVDIVIVLLFVRLIKSRFCLCILVVTVKIYTEFHFDGGRVYNKSTSLLDATKMSG